MELKFDANAYESIIGLVAEMREAQRAYFRERTPTTLELARRLERKVDQAIAGLNDPQRELF